MDRERMELNKVKPLRVLGKGALGTVFLVELDNKSHVALKVLNKTSTNSDAQRRARWEVNLLSGFSHPFLPSLLGFSETEELLGWALPYCPGTDLNRLRHRQTDHVFSPPAIRFYLSQILSALQHLHSLSIAYRDLKPENVLIQRSGHVTLTDFDLSKSLSPKTTTSSVDVPLRPKIKPKPKPARVSPASKRTRQSFLCSNSFVGTEEYVAPELIRGDGHGFAVDWWALGVLAYEMLYGATPFKGKSRKETFRNVLLKEAPLVGKRTALTDLISRLLQKDPARRLGYAGGASEIKEHEFFRGLKWDLLTEVARPPFIPSPDDDVALPQKPFANGLDIRGYFQSLKAPLPSLPPSPSPSPSSEFQKKNVDLPQL